MPDNPNLPVVDEIVLVDVVKWVVGWDWPTVDYDASVALCESRSRGQYPSSSGEQTPGPR